MANEDPTDRDPAEGGDGDDLVTSEGVNETAAEDSPGASISEPGGADAEPNEPG